MFRLPTALVILSTALIAVAAPRGASQVSTDWVEETAGVSIAVDEANNVYTLYYTYALGAEMTLIKRDVLGNLLWEASYDQKDSTKWEAATWVAVDSEGNAIVTGTLKSGYSNPVNAASIVMKFAPDGTFLWRRVYESDFDGSFTRRCLIDADDSIYVLGMGSGPSGYVSKIKKFAPDGSTLWTWYDSAGIGAPVLFKFAPGGDLLVSAHSIYGSVEGFARVAADGTTVWSYPGIQTVITGDLAGDSFGNTYIVHGEYVSNGGVVVKKLDAAGRLLFESVYSDVLAQRIEVGPDDQPVLCGYPNNGSFGAAFFKIDASGAVLWSNLDADGPLSLLLHAKLIVDDSNDAYLAAGTLFDMAICKVHADGTSAWTQLMPRSYATDFVLGSHDQSVFVVGGATARLLDAEEGPWINVGLSLAGGAGAPLLYGEGSLAARTPFALQLADAAPNANSFLVFGASRIDLPFLGGTMVPLPEVLVPGLRTDGAGDWTFSSTVPDGVPPGIDFYFQVWVRDRAAPFGFAASNGLRAITP